ncbi:Leader peptidase (Prepilin peptidase) [Candidatus Rhodobacter oscarellae]|uniref:Leader peptidase (Prepilin peptidase) n=1 Tax=Candidatus Rhodobacter oscarellae TaxID=1675527 RepID=A0A0J9E9D1_9RHOB|nr:A24 family peptidase [Candidatus Rhodobacter lobularis]KMW59402.1 Leader peptidase (Prepilin peptidase) [Candidatus Rhodobacter lobularis]
MSLVHLDLAAASVLAGLLGWATLRDLERYEIPDAASLGLVAIGLALSPWSAVTQPQAALLGAALGYGVFAGLGELYFRRTGIDGLGLGDAKLLAAAGAWLGWAALPLVVGLAAVSALCFAVITRRRRLAFGPWLSMAFWMIWVARGMTGLDGL